ncbi:hypothetical protein [Rothia sp. CCM 9416]|uniref:hypothetical protein n=1 Tax=Rothia sp. CCM 9416 TaxID=3402655 RepID=UPI003AE6DCF8
MSKTISSLEPRDDVVLVDRLYKLEDAAELLGYESANYLREMIHAGKAEYVDLNPNGNRPVFRMRASQINRLIDSMTFGAAPRLQGLAS